jgi:hypothetical protein
MFKLRARTVPEGDLQVVKNDLNYRDGWVFFCEEHVKQVFPHAIFHPDIDFQQELWNDFQY